MSKNLTIDEGGESRHFDGVKRLKTKLAGEDGGSCYWVPDDETQAWPTFIMDNGMHVAAEEGHYGYSEANVNVFIPTPFPEWDVWIDDIDVPHIKIDDITIDDWHIDDIELTIDPDLGTPIVDMEGIDMDGFEIPDINIYMPGGSPISDIDFKTDIHVWTDPDDHTKIHVKEEPNGEELVLDYDDIDGTATFKGLLDIRYDDTIIGEERWVIEAHTKIKVDDVVYEAGDEIKSWSKETVVDFTMKVEQEISVDFPDIDPDFMDDFDVILDMDNMDLDMDGIDMDIDLPLLKMPDLDDQLPDEIRIMHVPDKTSYKDGEAIDLDGIVVQAYKDGAVWQNNKYVNGYIPAHELSFDPRFAEYDEEHSYSEKDGMSFHGSLSMSGDYYYSPAEMVLKHIDLKINPSGLLHVGVCGDRYSAGGTLKYAVYKFTIYGTQPDLGTRIIDGVEYPIKGTKADPKLNPHYKEPFYTWFDGSTATQYFLGSVDSPYELFMEYNPEGKFYTPGNSSEIAYDALYSGEELKKKSNQTIAVSWPRPVDSQILSATFDITIEPDE